MSTQWNWLLQLRKALDKHLEHTQVYVQVRFKSIGAHEEFMIFAFSFYSKMSYKNRGILKLSDMLPRISLYAMSSSKERFNYGSLPFIDVKLKKMVIF